MKSNWGVIMPDSRLCQFIMPAKFADERPDLIVGPMSSMLVMACKFVNDGGRKGLHYICWHKDFPTMPPRAVVPSENPSDFIPWITAAVNNNPNDPDSGIYRYEWTEVKTGRIVLRGEYTVIPPSANENGHLQ